MTKDEMIVEIEQLRNTQDRYRTLLDQSSDAIFSFNKDGQYLYVNQQFAKSVSDKKPEYIIGKRIWDIFSKEEADKRFAVVKSVFQNGKTKNIEVRVPMTDGDKYYLTTVKPILDEQDNVSIVICISKEITERKHIEDERENLIKELQIALSEIKTLRGILPICSFCKKIRDDKGYWSQVEVYVKEHTEADFSHSYCPECAKTHYPDFFNEKGVY